MCVSALISLPSHQYSSYHHCSIYTDMLPLFSFFFFHSSSTFHHYLSLIFHLHNYSIYYFSISSSIILFLNLFFHNYFSPLSSYSVIITFLYTLICFLCFSLYFFLPIFNIPPTSFLNLLPT